MESWDRDKLETKYRAGRVEPLVTFQPMVSSVNSEQFAYIGREPERIAEPTEVNEVARMEWVPLASVLDLIAAGEIWESGALVALQRVLPDRR